METTKEMRIKKVNNNYVIINFPYEEHHRGKNYAAIIRGLDEKFGLKREFLVKGKEIDGKRLYIFPEKPKVGDIVEIMAIYHTRSGHRSVLEGSGFYEIQPDGTLKQISASEVKKRFTKYEDEVSL